MSEGTLSLAMPKSPRAICPSANCRVSAGSFDLHTGHSVDVTFAPSLPIKSRADAVVSWQARGNDYFM
jgi:hypothetical protein